MSDARRMPEIALSCPEADVLPFGQSDGFAPILLKKVADFRAVIAHRGAAPPPDSSSA
jgi:hypothetical protein